MAESPRTARSVDHIEDYVAGISDDLQILVTRLDDAESRNIQREMITTISRLATAIENLYSIHVAMFRDHAGNSSGDNRGRPPESTPEAA